MAQKTILVIEDNPDNLELICILLEQNGYKTLAAVDGTKGLHMALENKPDLILLDLTIPEIDGWTLAAQLKGNPDTAGIKVVALTAHTLPGDRKRAMDAGCDGYITKPLDVKFFSDLIASLLSKR